MTVDVWQCLASAMVGGFIAVACWQTVSVWARKR